MQYKVGSVNVTNNSPTVTGDITAWMPEVSVGDLFTVVGSNVTYQIAAVVSDTELTLGIPYQQATQTSVDYVIARSFTPNLHLPYPESGDVETAAIYRKAFERLDGLIQLDTTIEDPQADEVLVYNGTTWVNAPVVVATVWGGVTGDIEDQEDLILILDGKASAGHDHSGVYSPVAHNHDSTYAALGHDHSGVYSPVGHNHSGVYQPVDAQLTDLADNLTSSAAELNILDGATLSTTELNFVDGVTSAIQTQLDGKAASGHDHSGVYQPVDSTLTALAAYNTNGIIVQTGADTFTGRTLTGTSNQITVTDGNGVSGNPTVSIPSNPVLPGVVTATGFASAEYDAGSSSTSKTITWSNGQNQTVSMTGNCTFTFASPTAGATYKLKLVQSSGSNTAVWPGTVKWAGGAAPTLSTAASAIDIVSLYYNGTNYYGMAGIGFA